MSLQRPFSPNGTQRAISWPASSTCLPRSQDACNPEFTVPDCLSLSPTLDALVACLDTYTVLWETYNEASYLAAQPTLAQRQAIKVAVNDVLHVDGNCACLSVPEALAGFYKITPFVDQSGPLETTYCVFSEITLPHQTKFRKGWGTLIVPATQPAVHRDIHVSAPHPQTDSETPKQAISVFKSTGAKSFLFPGRLRDAYFAGTSCIGPKYHATDPAHDDREVFFLISTLLSSWQGPCPPSSCAFIQFHGKGPRTCPNDTVFITAGVDTKQSYEDENMPAVRVRNVVARLSKELGWTINLPSTSQCILKATKNVVGRLLNGVPEGDVCTTGAMSASGQFVHIEQAMVSRQASSHELWIEAIKEAFAISPRWYSMRSYM